jgi:hypothetical protein
MDSGDHLGKIVADAVPSLELTLEAMDLAVDPGLTIVTYSAEPGTPSEESLGLLATLVATEAAERSQAPARPDRFPSS